MCWRVALDRVLFPRFDSVAYVALLVSCRYLRGLPLSDVMCIRPFVSGSTAYLRSWYWRKGLKFEWLRAVWWVEAGPWKDSYRHTSNERNQSPSPWLQCRTRTHQNQHRGPHHRFWLNINNVTEDPHSPDDKWLWETLVDLRSMAEPFEFWLTYTSSTSPAANIG